MGAFLLDSNVFIQAHRMYYPFDVVPNFWIKLRELSNEGTIMSIDKVKKELCDVANPDILSHWCHEIDIFDNTDSCIDKYVEIAIWTNNQGKFNQNAKDEFLATDLADQMFRELRETF